MLCLCRFTARSWPSVSGLGTVARSGLQGARARLSGASGLSAVGTAWEEEGRATYVRSTRRKIPFWRASPCLSRGGGGAVVMRHPGTPAPTPPVLHHAQPDPASSALRPPLPPRFPAMRFSWMFIPVLPMVCRPHRVLWIIPSLRSPLKFRVCVFYRSVHNLPQPGVTCPFQE